MLFQRSDGQVMRMEVQPAAIDMLKQLLAHAERQRQQQQHQQQQHRLSSSSSSSSFRPTSAAAAGAQRAPVSEGVAPLRVSQLECADEFERYCILTLFERKGCLKID